MPVVVPGVCRFAVNQRYGPQEVINILDMQIDTTGTIDSREEGIFNVAGDIINNWMDHISAQGVQGLVVENVSWVDLDSEDGSVGSRNSTSAWTLPDTEGYVGNGFPGNVAVLVTKQVRGTRTSRNGRMYLAGADEAQTTAAAPSTLTASAITSYNAALALFLSGINDAEGLDDITRQLVVVSGAETASPTYNPVENLTVQATLATQRRRLRD